MKSAVGAITEGDVRRTTTMVTTPVSVRRDSTAAIVRVTAVYSLSLKIQEVWWRVGGWECTRLILVSRSLVVSNLFLSNVLICWLAKVSAKSSID